MHIVKEQQNMTRRTDEKGRTWNYVDIYCNWTVFYYGSHKAISNIYVKWYISLEFLLFDGEWGDIWLATLDCKIPGGNMVCLVWRSIGIMEELWALPGGWHPINNVSTKGISGFKTTKKVSAFD